MASVFFGAPADYYGASAAKKAKRKRIVAGFATGGMSLIFRKKNKRKLGATAAIAATGGAALPFVLAARAIRKRKAARKAKIAKLRGSQTAAAGLTPSTISSVPAAPVVTGSTAYAPAVGPSAMDMAPATSRAEQDAQDQAEEEEGEPQKPAPKKGLGALAVVAPLAALGFLL